MAKGNYRSKIRSIKLSSFWGEARPAKSESGDEELFHGGSPSAFVVRTTNSRQTPKPVRMMRIFALLALAAPAAAQLTCAEDLDGDGNVNVSLTARTDQLPDLALGAGTDNKRIDVRAGQ